MSDEIVYRFTPPFEGAFLQGVPRRDLTQRDVDKLHPLVQRDAFGDHPGYGKPLYTRVAKAEPKADKKAGDA